MTCCERGNEHTVRKHKYIMNKILRFCFFQDVVHIITIALYLKFAFLSRVYATVMYIK
jgi:hypothetical protein